MNGTVFLRIIPSQEIVINFNPGLQPQVYNLGLVPDLMEEAESTKTYLVNNLIIKIEWYISEI
jgi:hypothetical protein